MTKVHPCQRLKPFGGEGGRLNGAGAGIFTMINASSPHLCDFEGRERDVQNRAANGLPITFALCLLVSVVIEGSLGAGADDSSFFTTWPNLVVCAQAAFGQTRLFPRGPPESLPVASDLR